VTLEGGAEKLRTIHEITRGDTKSA
jgi:hypothetical protein